MTTLRKLVLGETWSLPAGIAIAILGAFALREIAGERDWWAHAGGLVLLVLLLVAFVAALRFGR